MMSEKEIKSMLEIHEANFIGIGRVYKKYAKLVGKKALERTSIQNDIEIQGAIVNTLRIVLGQPLINDEKRTRKIPIQKSPLRSSGGKIRQNKGKVKPNDTAKRNKG